ncbi:hypothetical protein CASFOL_023492 [Castilleja foliolosa]|uniref:NB-ARC domain-containing protein n=1 Tax=Castilleja foliolosa TaxID=1961234 RepID=A0ABD3CKQ3_9LAMI
MAAYAALVSLMNIIDNIENHHSPPITLHKQQVQSLTQNITFLKQFLEAYNPQTSESCEELADPFEMHIADAAYAAEDVIESHIVDTIQLNRPNQISYVARFFNCSRTLVRGPTLICWASMTPHSKSWESSKGTTLARNIFERKLINDHFDICAWATISQQYNTREILCEVYSQATKMDKEKLSGMDENDLGSKLYKYLFGRRFLVVIDDMWSIEAWDEIQHSFPDNGNGSRIMVTTRLSELSSQLNNDSSLRMNFLDEATSWDLFSKTVFGEKSCPDELMKIGKKIVYNCRGLPLSIVVVGGLLKKMDATQRCWESIGSNLTSVVNLENDKHCLRLLRLSYNHLPVYLKPCFFYMGVFEEDDEIKVSTLVKLWIYEGFLKPVSGGDSLETSAEEFLKELVDRNLVLIDRLGSTGNIKTWECSPRGINSQRRVIIPKNTSKRKVLGDLRSMPSVRSVICEYGKVPRCRNLRLMRTLHAYKFRTYKEKSYKQSLVFRYHVNLQHLAVKVRNVSSFISSLNLLWNLKTIIISCPSKSNPIVEIWKMPQLRHIEFENGFHLLDRDEEDVVNIMENLQVLKGVREFKCSEEVVKRIPNIKKLSIITGTNIDEYFPNISNIKFLCKLESFNVSEDYASIRRAPYPNYPLTFPQSLKKLTWKINLNGRTCWKRWDHCPFLRS